MSFLSIVDTVLFGPLKLLFEVIYVAAYKVLENPGLSIIALSLVMNLLILPLYRRADQMQEEERLIEQKLHPGVQHIKKTFQGDERMMMLQTYYRQNHYKPTYVLRSAVSLFLQIPFFIAAYRFLSELSLLNGVSFGPIADLSKPDGLLWIGNTAFNLLPVIMTAVNLVSCVIFTKGSPLKSKIQLYAMALFFLFFLYSSPSGLVFYWTLNNVFSLIKTIFYKLKRPGRVLAVLAAVCGVAAAVFGLFFYPQGTFNKKVFLIGAGVLMTIPIIVSLIRSRKKEPATEAQVMPNKKLFFAGAFFLAVLTGITIPASVIKSSPQEFFTPQLFVHPIWYIVSAFCLAFGAFVIWAGVFYSLAQNKAKVVFEKVVFAACIAAVINYMLFGTDHGLLSSSLKYEHGMEYGGGTILLNLAVMTAIFALIFLLWKKMRKVLFSALIVFICAVSLMSALDVVSINQGTGDIVKQIEQANEFPTIKLSKTGKNVVVIMLDKAMGTYIPYIFEEKPELKELYDGFTYYSNALSYGSSTNVGSPGLFGGYDYIPEKMNSRSSEDLVDKHNEALKLMPTLFSESGYDVTVFDPPFANYQWNPDISVFDDMEGVDAYIAEERFTPKESLQQLINNNMRNFFCFSLMKSSPVILQKNLYDSGLYFRSDSDVEAVQSTVANIIDTSHSTGISIDTLNAYNELDNLTGITRIEEDVSNAFFYMANSLTHEPNLMQEPEFVPSLIVDNSEYDAAHPDRFTHNGVTLKMSSTYQISSYETNVAALLKLGEWLEFLKQEGIYDNTRIIIVSDHGIPWIGHNNDAFSISGAYHQSGIPFTIEAFTCLLLVKDFNSTGYTESKEFMTNADVPTIALSEIIEDPVNPFTGNKIDSSYKEADPQYFVYSDGGLNVSIDADNKTFIPMAWYELSGKEVYDIKNWKVNAESSKLPIRN